MHIDKVIIVVFLLITAGVAKMTAQELSYKTKAFSVDYFQDGSEVECKDFESTLYQNRESERLWKSSNTSRIIASLSGAAAGYGCGRLIRNQRGDSKGTYYGMMIGGIALSAVLFGQSKRQQRKAVEVYNENGPTVSNIEIVPASSGFGFAIQF